MPRKATAAPATPLPETNTEAFQQEASSLVMLGDIAQGMQDERDLVNQLLGQAQMADAFGKFSQTVWSSKLAYVKENKLYRALRGKKGPNGLEFSGNWEEFCGLLGVSDEKANQDIANLRAFGEEALESMSRMGIGYREMRQWRQLPDDSLGALREAAKQGNREAIEYLADELVAKHSAERAELEKRLADVKGDYDALSKVEGDTSKKLRETKLELERTQLRTAPWSDKIAPFQIEIAKRQTIIDEAAGRHLQAVEALDAFWLGELAAQPDYDPETPAEMPLEVSTVLVELHDAISRGARLIAAARNELLNRFGPELEKALQHQLQLEDEPA